MERVGLKKTIELDTPPLGGVIASVPVLVRLGCECGHHTVITVEAHDNGKGRYVIHAPDAGWRCEACGDVAREVEVML